MVIGLIVIKGLFCRELHECDVNDVNRQCRILCLDTVQYFINLIGVVSEIFESFREYLRIEMNR